MAALHNTRENNTPKKIPARRIPSFVENSRFSSAPELQYPLNHICTHVTPLIGHYYQTGEDKEPVVRVDELVDVVEDSWTRVYKCDCSKKDRADVIWRFFKRIGERKYDAAKYNCESFVRHLINGKSLSLQSHWTVFAPWFQVPRLMVGGALRGTSQASAAVSRSSSSAVK